MGVPFLGFWYWSTNQYIFQRVLGAKDIKQARWGVIFAGFLKIIPLFIMVIPGAMAISLFPDIANGDQVFPTLVTKVLPVGLIGLVLAGVISAIMSSVDSALNSSSTLLVIDFIKPIKKDVTEKDIVKYGRISTLIFMVIAALWAPQIQNFTGLWDYPQQMFSIIVPPVAVIFLVGVFFKRGNGDGAFWTLVLGTLAGIGLFVLEQFDMWHLHYTINVGFMVLFSTVIFIIVSLTTAAPDLEKMKLLTYRKELLMDGFENVPWYINYIYHIIILVIVITYILIWLW